MIHFVVPEAHGAPMREYVEVWGKVVGDRLSVVYAESLPRVSHVAPGTYVLAALDQYSPSMAAFIDAFHRTLAARDDVRFLNHPIATLQRFALLDELHAQGRNAFRAIRIGGDLRSLTYPVFVRDEVSHDGALTELLHTPAQVEAAIGRALLQGHVARHLMVVEFCDTADDDGYYRKYAAFGIGGEIVPRSVSYSRSWMLKFQGGELSAHMAREEHDYVLSNPHEESLRELFALARVDYGRMDYAVKDGCIQTWEINLNPTIGRGLQPSTGTQSAEVTAIRKPTKEHFYRRFRDAWDSVNLASASDATIPLTIDDGVVRRALATEPLNGRWLTGFRRVLRPVKASGPE